MFRWVVGVAVAVCCSVSWGQPLADRVPPDAMVYVGWAGTQNLPGYEKSHLKAVIDASDAPKVFSEMLPALAAKISERDPRGAEKLRMVMDLAKPFLKHPSAFYISGIDLAPTTRPRVRMTVLCNAGDDAAALVEKINAIRQQIPPSPNEPIDVSSSNGVVSVCVGPADTTSGKLADVAAFKKDFSGKPGALAIYVDCDAMRKSIDAMVQAEPGPPEKKQHFERIEKALGLADVHRFSCIARFEDGNWTTQAFLDAPEIRSGLLAAVANGWVSDDTLKLIPRSAVVAAARKFSMAQFYDHIRQTLGDVDPRWQLNFDRALGVASLTAGFNIKSDLFDALGDDWVAYSSPEIAGNGGLGTVLVNRLADPTKAQHSLESLELAMNSLVASRMHNPRIRIAFRAMDYHGLRIHYLPLPLVAPAWVIDGDRLYVALYPQVISAADELAHSMKGSILDNPKFSNLRKSLGEHFEAIHFVDCQAGIEAGYPAWMMLTHYLGLADMLGVDSPAMFLPPLPAIRSQLTPAMSVCWWDNTGWHERGTTPFPGAGLLAGDTLSFISVGGAAMTASVLLPALNRSREVANRVKCASNMRQIGQAILLYSNEHNGKFPSDFGSLIIDEEISPQVFFCPSAAAVPMPADFSAMPPEAKAAWLDQHSDYIYVGKGQTSSEPPDRIVLYERESDHRGDGMNMLFADGHVEFVKIPAATGLLERQQKALSH